MHLPVFTGGYRVILQLGRGGMADVSLASVQDATGVTKFVVLKCLRGDVADDPEFVAMFLDEARLACQLDHPNCVRVNEVGHDNGKYFLAMEYLDGQPLHRIIARAVRKAETFPQAMWLRVLSDAVSGLHYAHELRGADGQPLEVVHRDVTPENVFVTYAGVIKLVDFGIAKATGRSVETKMGVVKGKIAYLSPEQAYGGRLTIDRRTDIFAVGVMLWEVATLRRFWAGCDDTEIITRLIHGNFNPSPRAVDPTVPEALDAICRKALAPLAQDRYATAAELHRDLEAFIGSKFGTVNLADLGGWVAERFARERTIVKQAIEASVEEPQEDKAPGTSAEPGSFAVGAQSAPLVSLSTADAAPPKVVRASPSQRVRAIRREGAQKSTVAGILLAIVGAALCGAAGLKLMQPAPAAPASKVSLRLTAIPDDARFRIDDGLWLSNPHVAMVEADGKSHELRIEAPGHAARVVSVKFEDDKWVRVALASNGK